MFQNKIKIYLSLFDNNQLLLINIFLNFGVFYFFRKLNKEELYKKKKHNYY